MLLNGQAGTVFAHASHPPHANDFSLTSTPSYQPSPNASSTSSPVPLAFSRSALSVLPSLAASAAAGMGYAGPLYIATVNGQQCLIAPSPSSALQYLPHQLQQFVVMGAQQQQQMQQAQQGGGLGDASEAPSSYALQMALQQQFQRAHQKAQLALVKGERQHSSSSSSSPPSPSMSFPSSASPASHFAVASPPPVVRSRTSPMKFSPSRPSLASVATSPVHPSAASVTVAGVALSASSPLVLLSPRPAHTTAPSLSVTTGVAGTDINVSDSEPAVRPARAKVVSNEVNAMEALASAAAALLSADDASSTSSTSPSPSSVSPTPLLTSSTAVAASPAAVQLSSVHFAHPVASSPRVIHSSPAVKSALIQKSLSSNSLCNPLLLSPRMPMSPPRPAAAGAAAAAAELGLVKESFFSSPRMASAASGGSSSSPLLTHSRPQMMMSDSVTSRSSIISPRYPHHPPKIGRQYQAQVPQLLLSQSVPPSPLHHTAASGVGGEGLGAVSSRRVQSASAATSPHGGSLLHLLSAASRGEDDEGSESGSDSSDEEELVAESAVELKRRHERKRREASAELSRKRQSASAIALRQPSNGASKDKTQTLSGQQQADRHAADEASSAVASPEATASAETTDGERRKSVTPPARKRRRLSKEETKSSSPPTAPPRARPTMLPKAQAAVKEEKRADESAASLDSILSELVGSAAALEGKGRLGRSRMTRNSLFAILDSVIPDTTPLALPPPRKSRKKSDPRADADVEKKTDRVEDVEDLTSVASSPGTSLAPGPGTPPFVSLSSVRAVSEGAHAQAVLSPRLPPSSGFDANVSSSSTPSSPSVDLSVDAASMQPAASPLQSPLPMPSVPSSPSTTNDSFDSVTNDVLSPPRSTAKGAKEELTTTPPELPSPSLEQPTSSDGIIAEHSKQEGVDAVADGDAARLDGPVAAVPCAILKKQRGKGNTAKRGRSVNSTPVPAAASAENISQADVQQADAEEVGSTVVQAPEVEALVEADTNPAPPNDVTSPSPPPIVPLAASAHVKTEVVDCDVEVIEKTHVGQGNARAAAASLAKTRPKRVIVETERARLARIARDENASATFISQYLSAYVEQKLHTPAATRTRRKAQQQNAQLGERKAAFVEEVEERRGKRTLKVRKLKTEAVVEELMKDVQQHGHAGEESDGSLHWSPAVSTDLERDLSMSPVPMLEVGHEGTAEAFQAVGVHTHAQVDATGNGQHAAGEQSEGGAAGAADGSEQDGTQSGKGADDGRATRGQEEANGNGEGGASNGTAGSGASSGGGGDGGDGGSGEDKQRKDGDESGDKKKDDGSAANAADSDDDTAKRSSASRRAPSSSAMDVDSESEAEATFSDSDLSDLTSSSSSSSSEEETESSSSEEEEEQPKKRVRRSELDKLHEGFAAIVTMEKKKQRRADRERLRAERKAEEARHKAERRRQRELRHQEKRAQKRAAKKAGTVAPLTEEERLQRAQRHAQRASKRAAKAAAEQPADDDVDEAESAPQAAAKASGKKAPVKAAVRASTISRKRKPDQAEDDEPEEEEAEAPEDKDDADEEYQVDADGDADMDAEDDEEFEESEEGSSAKKKTAAAVSAAKKKRGRAGAAKERAAGAPVVDAASTHRKAMLAKLLDEADVESPSSGEDSPSKPVKTDTSTAAISPTGAQTTSAPSADSSPLKDSATVVPSPAPASASAAVASMADGASEMKAAPLKKITKTPEKKGSAAKPAVDRELKGLSREERRRVEQERAKALTNPTPPAAAKKFGTPGAPNRRNAAKQPQPARSAGKKDIRAENDKATVASQSVASLPSPPQTASPPSEVSRAESVASSEGERAMDADGGVQRREERGGEVARPSPAVAAAERRVKIPKKEERSVGKPKAVVVRSQPTSSTAQPGGSSAGTTHVKRVYRNSTQSKAAVKSPGESDAEEAVDDEDEAALWASDDDEEVVAVAKKVRGTRPPVSPPLSPTFPLDLRSAALPATSAPLSPPMSPTFGLPPAAFASTTAAAGTAAPAVSSLPSPGRGSSPAAAAPAPAGPQRQAKTMNSSFWTDEELTALREGVAQFGMDFDAVKKHNAALFKRRNPANLREKMSMLLNQEE